jgi:hypothetical protein
VPLEEMARMFGDDDQIYKEGVLSRPEKEARSGFERLDADNAKRTPKDRNLGRNGTYLLIVASSEFNYHHFIFLFGA